MGILRGGDRVIMMAKFDARDSLRCIDEYKITHSQWVPTMFVRMLKLDPEDRDGWDLSSHEVAIHAAEYHNDAGKTRSAQHPEHPSWSSLGDVGYLDEEGYLYLTDRKTFMIISGGVNIYPQEIEDAFIMNPKVADVAVFGVPNEDFGEEVKAVVELADGIEPSESLEQELMAFSREHLAHYMCPRSIDFIDELPRLPTGKLYKRILRDKYWGKHATKIV